MIHILIFSFCLTGVLCESCHLPSGSPASCVQIKQCLHVTSLLANLQKPLPKDVALLIRESYFCGTKQGEVAVCCPREGLSDQDDDDDDDDDGSKNTGVEERSYCEYQASVPSSCVLYTKCLPFVQMMANLRKPLPSSVSSLVASSYLCGVTEDENNRRYPNICCPTAALNDVSSNTDNDDDNDDDDELEARGPSHPYADHPSSTKLASVMSCGQSMSPYIVGGKTASLGQYPWLVNLGYSQRGKQKTVYKCGGTLIGKCQQ